MRSRQARSRCCAGAQINASCGGPAIVLRSRGCAAPITNLRAAMRESRAPFLPLGKARNCEKTLHQRQSRQRRTTSDRSSFRRSIWSPSLLRVTETLSVSNAPRLAALRTLTNGSDPPRVGSRLPPHRASREKGRVRRRRSRRWSPDRRTGRAARATGP
jgi:hypothetical protein